MNWDWRDQLPRSGGSRPRRRHEERCGGDPAGHPPRRSNSGRRPRSGWPSADLTKGFRHPTIRLQSAAGKIFGKAKVQSNLIVWLKTDQRRKAAFGSRGQPATVGKRDDCDRPIAGLAELLWIDLCRLWKRVRNGKERDAGKNCQPGNKRGEFHAGFLARLRYLMLDRHFENRIKQIENPIASDGRPPLPQCLGKK